MGGATRPPGADAQPGQISIHAPRGGSDDRSHISASWVSISIHAPRGGSDSLRSAARGWPRHFNPRSPWGERPRDLARYPRLGGFQSTLPVGGATSNPNWGGKMAVFQSTLPVGGATHSLQRLPSYPKISIHAPRGGSDYLQEIRPPQTAYFNPRSPWGERQHPGGHIRLTLADFNPRSPWGERQSLKIRSPVPWTFQSTLPVGGATPKPEYI